MQIYNIFELSNYFVLVEALSNQLGILFFLGLIGLGIIFWKKNKVEAISLSLLAMGIIYFFMMDVYEYIGYSRWNLFLIPILFYTTFNLIILLKAHYQKFVLLLLLVSNIFLVPIHFEGVRLPNWGSPLTDTTEYTYPYEKTIKGLSEEGKTRHILVTGHYFPYYVTFYLNKYNFEPELSQYLWGRERFNKTTEYELFGTFFEMYSNSNITTNNFYRILGEEDLSTVDTIVYHSVNNINLDKNMLYGGQFKVIKKIYNKEHTLYVLKRV